MGKLTTLALGRSGATSPLSAAETAFLDSVEEGRVTHLPGATLSAAWLSWLLTNREANAAVGMGGINLSGDAASPLRLAGPWEAPHGKANFPIILERCEYDSGIDLSFAELTLLSFEACSTKNISLRGAAVGWLRFRHNSSCAGGVILTLARIERGADFNSATVTGAGTPAIAADWLRSNGPLNFATRAPHTPPFVASGAISLYGAHIGGELNMRNVILRNSGDDALNIDQCTIEGSAALRHAHVRGSVSLIGADIRGHFIAEGLDLRDGRVDSVRKTALALIGDHARIGGSVYLRHGFHAAGAVRLYGATIDRDLECQGATFINRDAVALTTEGARIEGDVHFANVERPTQCHIEGRVNLSRTNIKGSLVWREIRPVDKVTLDLQSARATTLNDDQECWPQPGHLDLHNFEYESIAEDCRLDAASRAKWLTLSDGFSHQAYDQLATVLRRQGRNADARDIMFRKEQRYATEMQLSLGDRWWYGVGVGNFRIGFGPLAGYGYRLKWSSIAMFATIGLCAALYASGSSLMTKTSEHAPQLQSLMYSLDVFVPIIDFGQGGAWIPDANRGAVLMNGVWGDLRTGGLLLAAHWIEIALGWCVSSVLVGTITARLVRD